MFGWIYVQTYFLLWDLVYLDPEDLEYSVNRITFCWVHVIIFRKLKFLKYKDCANHMHLMLDLNIQSYEHIQVPGGLGKQVPL